MKKKKAKILDVLAKCADACNICAIACLQEKDIAKLKNCIAMDIECAQMCQLTESFIARDSLHSYHLLKECAEMCGLCAEECHKHKHMDHCKECYEACKKCAKECNELLGKKSKK